MGVGVSSFGEGADSQQRLLYFHFSEHLERGAKKSQVAVSATTAVYDGLEILCALAPNTGLRLSDK